MKSKVFLVAICTLFLSTSISFGYQATFTPRISVSEEYTDNFFSTAENKEDEYITRITPGFTAGLLGKNIGADLSYDFGYVKYDKYDQRDNWEHLVRFSGWSNLGKNTRLDLTDTFLYTQDPLIQNDIAVIRTEEPTFPIDSTIRQGRRTYYSNYVGANLNHQFGKSDSIRLGYVYSFLKNESPVYDDNDRYNPSIGLTYWFLPQWGLEANGSYTRGEFDIAPDRDLLDGNISLIKNFSKHFQGHIKYSHLAVNYKGENEDDQTYNPSIGFSYLIADDTDLYLDIGYFRNDFEFREDQSGPTLDGRLIKSFRRGSLNLSVIGGYDYSIFGAQDLNFTKYYEGGASATYQLAKYISGNVFGSYRYDEYPDTLDNREDKTTRAGLGLSIQALPWMSVGLSYIYRLVNSTSSVNNYDVNTIYLGITLSPSRPFRTSRY